MIPSLVKRGRRAARTSDASGIPSGLPTLLEGEGGKLLAFGLDWRAITGLDASSQIIKEDAEIKKNAKALGAQRFVRIVGSKSLVAGYMAGKPPKKGKVYSAAAFVASSVKAQNALLFYALPKKNSYALIGIRDKVPYPGFDLVGSKEEVIREGKKFLARAGTTGIQIFFDGDFDSDFQIQEFTPNSKVHPFEKWDVEIAELKALPNEMRKVGLALVGLCLLFGAYSFGHSYLDQRAKANSRAKYIPPAAKYKQSLAELFANEFQYSAAAEAARYLSAIENLPTRTKNERLWKLQSLACTSGSCFLNWERIDGVNEDLVKERDRMNIVFSDDLKTASEKIPVKDGRRVMPDSQSFPTHAQFKLQTGSMLQLLRKIGVQVDVGTPSMAGVWEGGRPPASAPVVKRGSWKIHGPLQFDDALLDLPGNMSLSNFTVTFTDAFASFSAEGYYYVR